MPNWRREKAKDCRVSPSRSASMSWLKPSRAPSGLKADEAPDRHCPVKSDQGRPNVADLHRRRLTAADPALRFARKGGKNMKDLAAQRAAEWLLAEHQAGHRFTTLAPQAAPATISDAYDIQDKYVALLRHGDAETAGYKVGLTSATMQAFCRIDHPIAGVVLASRVHRSGAKVRRSDFGRLGLEFEIAVRIKSDIPVTEKAFTAETIEPHIEGICAAIELVDDRA